MTVKQRWEADSIGSANAIKIAENRLGRAQAVVDYQTMAQKDFLAKYEGTGYGSKMGLGASLEADQEKLEEAKSEYKKAIKKYKRHLARKPH
jgi:hypothetical protein